MRSFGERLLGAAWLDPAVYEEVEHDAGALTQAAGVVLLSAAAAGVAELGRMHLGGVLVVTAAAIIGWGIWAFLILLIGTRLLPSPETEADFGQVLRTLGFAAAPGLVHVVGIIGALQPIVVVVAAVWTVAAMVVAVRQAFDYTSTLRAVGVCAIGWAVQMLVTAIVLAALVPHAYESSAVESQRQSEPASAGYVGVVKPRAIAPPVE